MRKEVHRLHTKPRRTLSIENKQSIVIPPLQLTSSRGYLSKCFPNELLLCKKSSRVDPCISFREFYKCDTEREATKSFKVYNSDFLYTFSKVDATQIPKVKRPLDKLQTSSRSVAFLKKTKSVNRIYSVDDLKDSIPGLEFSNSVELIQSLIESARRYSPGSFESCYSLKETASSFREWFHRTLAQFQSCRIDLCRLSISESYLKISQICNILGENTMAAFLELDKTYEELLDVERKTCENKHSEFTKQLYLVETKAKNEQERLNDIIQELKEDLAYLKLLQIEHKEDIRLYKEKCSILESKLSYANRQIFTFKQDYNNFSTPFNSFASPSPGARRSSVNPSIGIQTEPYVFSSELLSCSSSRTEVRERLRSKVRAVARLLRKAPSEIAEVPAEHSLLAYELHKEQARMYGLALKHSLQEQPIGKSQLLPADSDAKSLDLEAKESVNFKLTLNQIESVAEDVQVGDNTEGRRVKRSYSSADHKEAAKQDLKKLFIQIKVENQENKKLQAEEIRKKAEETVQEKIIQEEEQKINEQNISRILFHYKNVLKIDKDEDLIKKLCELYEAEHREKLIFSTRYNEELRITMKLKNDLQKLKNNLCKKEIGDSTNSDSQDVTPRSGLVLHKKAKIWTSATPKSSNKIDRAQSILLEVLKSSSKKLSKMSKKSVLKQLSTLYLERQKDLVSGSQKRELSMLNYVYDFYLRSFGLRKIAEMNCKAFLGSIRYFRNDFRVEMFSRFVGINDFEEYTIDELNKYLEAIKWGTRSEEFIKLSVSKAVEYTKTTFDRMGESLESVAQIRRGVEVMKDDQGLVDFDRFMEFFIKEYRLRINRTKQYVKNAFMAADLDANEECSKEEFVLLWKYISPETFEEEQARKLFDEKANETHQDGEIFMGFDRFSVVCAENRLFTENDQLFFLEVSSQEECSVLCQNLRDNWIEKKSLLNNLLDQYKSNRYHMDKIQSWNEILIQLDDRLMNEINPEKDISLLLSYKILESEISTFVEYCKTVEVDESTLTLATEPTSTEANVEHSESEHIYSLIQAQQISGIIQEEAGEGDYLDENSVSRNGRFDHNESNLSVQEEVNFSAVGKE